MKHHPSIRNNAVSNYKSKRVRIAFVLAFLFGPLGLFYTNPFGGFVTFSAGLISYLALPVAGLILIWIACIAWAVLSAARPKKIFSNGLTYYSPR